MRRTEIERRFDEIVDFAEIEKFLDTPVKHYSSGMYVRLAFAVAAHLEPEILLVDEVLAVGDTAFQKKCLGKMGEVAGEGRTVLFVSHQLGMINTLCEKALLLDRGNVMDVGATSEVVGQYVHLLSNDGEANATVEYREDATKQAQLIAATICGSDGQTSVRYDVFDQITLHVRYVIRELLTGVGVNLIVRRNGDILFLSFDTDDQPWLLDGRIPGAYASTVCLPTPLKAGHYTIDLSLGRLNIGGIDVRRDVLSFEVEESSFDASMRSYTESRPGVMAAHLQWQIRSDESMSNQVNKVEAK
jgi:lipopolysaccharide transport system ATP-binding protein